jgi:mRNA interferase MazF
MVSLVQYQIIIVNTGRNASSDLAEKPALILSPDEMNQYLQTIIIAPLTAQQTEYPTRVSVRVGGTPMQAVLEQIRVLPKSRVVRISGQLRRPEIQAVKDILREMLID